MSKFITTAVFNGTKTNYAIQGNSVDNIMVRLRRMRNVRYATLFMFYNRKTGKFVDMRMN